MNTEIKDTSELGDRGGLPKIIHLCWLSGDPFPDTIVKCLNTFSEHLSDYVIYLWGKAPAEADAVFRSFRGFQEMHFDLESVVWTQEAFAAKKYAFAADYIRLYALNNYGGIYLDADILMYKPFDALLHLPYFVGCDQIGGFEAAVIGCRRGCVWIKDLLDSYENKHFVKADGGYDEMELPVRFHHELIARGYKFRKIAKVSEFVEKREDEKVLMVFNGDFFNSRNAVKVRRTKQSFCAHNYLGSWQKKQKTKPFTVNWIKSFLPLWMLWVVYNVGQATWARKKYAFFQIPFENR